MIWSIAADLALAGLLGFLGQSIRALLGVKKMMVAGNMADFQWSILLISLAIGFVAGGLTGLTLMAADGFTLTGPVIVALIAAGYAETDAVEGLMKS